MNASTHSLTERLPHVLHQLQMFAALEHETREGAQQWIDSFTTFTPTLRAALLRAFDAARDAHLSARG